MDKKRALIWGGGVAGITAIAAAALALAPHHPRGLAALDLNQDGQIVNAEIQQSARQRFAELDRNHDGRLTGDEMPRGRHGHRHGHHGGPGPDGFGDEAPPPAAADANRAANVPGAERPRWGPASADTNGDGAVDLREFYRQMAARAARADANHDGTISAQELAAVREEHRGRHWG